MASESVTERREAPAVNTGRVLLLVGGFVLFVVLLFVALGSYYHYVVGRTVVARAPRAFPAPQLQPDPTQDYANFETAQVRQLAGYGWVDRARGLIHIPIEQAMALVAAKGSRAYDPLDPAPPNNAATPPGAADAGSRAVPSAAVSPYGKTQ